MNESVTTSPSFHPSSFILPPCSKELLHQLAAFRFQHAADYLDAMIQFIRAANLKVSINGAGLLVARAVNEQWDARLDQSAGTHCARFNRRIDRRIRQPVIADSLGRFPQSDNLGVGSRIAISARAIAGDRDDPIRDDDARADRHFLSRLSLARGA